MTNALFIILAVALVLLNAFFVAAEFGMVKLRNTRVATIKKSHGLKGRILASIHQHLDAYLSACQLGITLASVGLGWIGEPAFAHVLTPLFEWLGIFSKEVITILSFFIAFSFISFLHIVIGELMPKSLAIRQSEKVSLWTAIPLYVFYWVMYPAIWILNTCSNFLLKISGLSATHRNEHFYETDEIKMILTASYLHGELKKSEAEILEQTLDFADLKVTEVMRHMDEMVSLDVDDNYETMMKVMLQNRFSRYPVFDKSNDDYIGIVHVKDIFAAEYKAHKIVNLKSLVRPVLKVSQRLMALDLLPQFRIGKPHFALVYRGNKVIGFVTLDNLLHILIGRIQDEFHKTQDDWRINPDGSLLVRGDCPITSLERALDRDIDMSLGKAETMTGLILNKLGTFPKEGMRIDFPEFKATIEKMRGYRILTIKIVPKPKPREETD